MYNYDFIEFICIPSVGLGIIKHIFLVVLKFKKQMSS